MTEEQLKQGISLLYDMELNNYLMTRTISHLYYEIEDLGVRNRICKPDVPKEASWDSEIIGGWGSIGMILGAILGGVSGCNSTSSLFGSIGAGLDGLFIGGFGGMILAAIIGMIIAGIKKGKEDDEINAKYNQELRHYNKLVRQDEERVNRELQQKEYLTQVRKALIERRRSAKKQLDTFYDLMGIDEDFRYLMAIGYMKDLIRLRIATKLEGVDGLYKVVMEKLDRRMIMLTLEEISKKLDTVIDNQSKMYFEICDMNDKSDRMLNAVTKTAQISANNSKFLESAANDAAIAAFNSERSAREAEYQSFLMTINKK